MVLKNGSVRDALSNADLSFPDLYEQVFAKAEVRVDQMRKLEKQDLLHLGVSLGHAMTLIESLKKAPQGTPL